MGFWTRIGSIWRKKDGSGTFFKVDLRYGKENLDSVVLKNGQLLTIRDPRNSDKLSAEQKAKIPALLVAEVSLAPEDN